MSVIKITKENFNDEVLKASSDVIIDFFADWCGPCMMMAPVMEEIASENSSIKVCKVNVDEQPELAQRFNISSIPMIAAVRNGKVIMNAVGARPKSDILAMLKS